MAFGGGGSGFTFGSNNNSSSSTSGFGGFGTSSNNNTGFGANTNAGFSGNTSSTPFGGSTFGSNPSGTFGSTNTTTSLFGNKTDSNPFGSTSTGSNLFSNNNTANSSSSGGFGTSTFGTNNTTSAFGNSGQNAFSFGNTQSKPGFGASNTGSLFGSVNNNSNANTNTGFGSGTVLGGQVPPSEGTAAVAFSPTNETEGTSNAKSAYQSITFQQPYQKYSFEELRLADYNAGRRYGNGTSGFGTQNAFSTFSGNTGTGFGNTSNNTTSSNPFGSTATNTFGGGNNATSSFNSGGSTLFGSNNTNKPGSLFGQQSSATSTPSLFGTANNNNNTSNLFGGGNNTQSGSTSLFGTPQTQNKPSIFGGTGSGFGSNNTASGTTGGIFGNSNPTSASGFGTNNTATGSLFANNNNNPNQTKPAFGSGSTFGSTNTQTQSGGSLFNTGANNTNSLFGGGNNTSNNPAGTLFGAQPNNNTGGGLLGINNNNNNTANKSIFGSTPAFGTSNTANNSSGGGLFNTNQNSNQQSGGLFNNNNTSNSLFANNNNNNNNNTNKALFGGTSNTLTGQNSLFGGNNTSSSLFNTSVNQPNNQQQQQQQQQDGYKVASLLDPNPFGQSSIWTGLPSPTPENAKPLVTPLVATQKMKESMTKPIQSMRLSQSRYQTPRRGFGFSYSTYGTPNSAMSTPGSSSLNTSMFAGRNSLMGGSFPRYMGKSASVNNLRASFAADGDRALTAFSPGAFSKDGSRFANNSMRRLTIDRTIRPDLFSRPSLPALPISNGLINHAPKNDTPMTSNNDSSGDSVHKLKKRVSFDKDTTGGVSLGGLNSESGALVRVESDDDETIPEQPQRPSQISQAPNGTPSESGQSRNNELAAVPEDRESNDVTSQKRITKEVEAKADPQPGDYWMKPTRAEMSKMPRDKLQRFKNFEVGRHGCGRVVFNGDVDLTTIPLDDLYEKIVEIRLRSVTVYPDSSSKPPRGKGLNVPSTIYIENSWPRARNQPSSATSGPVFDKHINRLKKMAGTEFINYDVSSGVWTFKVPHYTRYGLDYDDEEQDEMSRSQLSAPPDSISSSKPADDSGMDTDEEDYRGSGPEDDTFAFKQKIIPGGFGRQSAIDFESVASLEGTTDGQAELSGGEDSEISDDDQPQREMSMVGSFPPQSRDMPSPVKPILKASTRQATPGKALLDLDGDWAEQLQRTISPRKQNRDALREVQNKVLLDRAYQPIKPTQTKDFRTSIDIMNSIFATRPEKKKGGTKGQAASDFEFPYAKRAKTADQDSEDLSEEDKAWLTSFKPQFTSTDGLVLRQQGNLPSNSANEKRVVLVGNHEGSVVLSEPQPQLRNLDVKNMLQKTRVTAKDGLPQVHYQAAPFSSFARGKDWAENDLYELAHVLFDEYEDEFTAGLTEQQKQDFMTRIRKDRLSRFLAAVVWRLHADKIKDAEKSSLTMAALLNLTAQNVRGACDALMKAKNFHLMALVAQIEHASSGFQEDIAKQIEAWREQTIIAEMSHEIRTLYDVLAGNTTISKGVTTGPVENRAATFTISEKCDLDWLQAFCLCFWYGKRKNGSIEDAVTDFASLVEDQYESAKPVVSFTDAAGHTTEHDDPFWTLLKLFTSSSKKPNFEQPTLPGALISLSRPGDCSQTFRFYNAIIANLPKSKIDPAEADKLAADLAVQTSAAGDIAGSVFALLHISQPKQRTTMLKNLLARHAATLPLPAETQSGENLSLWTLLTNDLKIPAEWIFEAKALYAKAQDDYLTELRHLLSAQMWEEAHETLVRRVAPRLVIDEDWELLQEIIRAFKGHDTKVRNWSQGGGVFEGFVLLVSGNLVAGQKRQILSQMQHNITDLGIKFAVTDQSLNSMGLEELEERVAIREMARMVAELLEEGGEKKGILGLPLTSDARIMHSGSMAVGYYRGLMATA